MGVKTYVVIGFLVVSFIIIGTVTAQGNDGILNEILDKVNELTKNDHLVCYPIEENKNEENWKIEYENQLEGNNIVIGQAEYFCVPTSKLSVNGEPTGEKKCVQAPLGMISWWAGDNNAKDIQDGNDGTLKNGAGFASGKVNESFDLDGTDDFVEVPDASNLDFGTGSFTIDAWVYPEPVAANHFYPVVFKATTSPSITGYEFYLTGATKKKLSLEIVDQQQNATATSTSNIIKNNQWTHVTGVVDRRAGEIRLYVDGSLQATQPIPANVGNVSNSADLYIGKNHAGGLFHNGLIDEVEIFDRALTQSEIQDIYDAQEEGKCKPEEPNECVETGDVPISSGTCKPITLINQNNLPKCCTEERPGGVNCGSNKEWVVGTAAEPLCYVVGS